MRPRLAFTLLFAFGLRAMAAEFDVRNEPEFRKLINSGAKLETLATGMKFTEGPQWVPAKGTEPGYLVFSDIPANQLKKWTTKDGVTVFREASNGANGNTLDLQGNLLTAEQGERRISVTEKSGKVWPLVETFDNRKFNSPNDLVMRKDGTVWFTDPDYGLAGRVKEQTGNHVYRYDQRTRKTAPVATDFDKPNGLAFSPDENQLYIADSGKPKHIRVFSLDADGRLVKGKVFCKIDNGGPDGIRCDSEGRVWSSAGDGVHIFSPDGELIGKVLVPETPANLCFGGDDLKALFITARTSLYSIKTQAKGIR